MASSELHLARHGRVLTRIVGIEQAAQGLGHLPRYRWIRRGDARHQAIDAFSGNERLLHARERIGTRCRAISNPVRSGHGRPQGQIQLALAIGRIWVRRII